MCLRAKYCAAVFYCYSSLSPFPFTASIDQKPRSAHQAPIARVHDVGAGHPGSAHVGPRRISEGQAARPPAARIMAGAAGRVGFSNKDGKQKKHDICFHDRIIESRDDVQPKQARSISRYPARHGGARQSSTGPHGRHCTSLPLSPQQRRTFRFSRPPGPERGLGGLAGLGTTPRLPEPRAGRGIGRWLCPERRGSRGPRRRLRGPLDPPFLAVFVRSGCGAVRWVPAAAKQQHTHEQTPTAVHRSFLKTGLFCRNYSAGTEVGQGQEEHEGDTVRSRFRKRHTQRSRVDRHGQTDSWNR